VNEVSLGNGLEPRGSEENAVASTATGFAALGLSEALLRAVQGAGYTEPTPIQEQAIPPALQGRDVLGCARTGTGKTAAFVLPMLQRFDARKEQRRLRMLVLAPTRELAAQIGESIATYGKHSDVRFTVIFGGVSQQRQVADLKRGVDIIVATPGRLVDLIDQGYARLSTIDTLVLDEFDRMLDQGFLPAIKRVLRELPTERQTLLFSATMPPELESVVKRIVRDPVRVSVSKTSSTPERIDQAVCFVEQPQKRYALEQLLADGQIARAVVFTRTKHGANRVAEHLVRARVDAEAIHGNKSQNARERTLARFRSGDLRVLVATDLAARGIDIDDISHVINYDLPVDAESYVHRIGRTARAGRDGAAISFCTHEDRPVLMRIERLTGQRLTVIDLKMSTSMPAASAPRPQQPIQHTLRPMPGAQRPQHDAQRPAYGGARPQLGGGQRAQDGALQTDSTRSNNNASRRFGSRQGKPPSFYGGR
jgi:ATP-dependent RNA helicase RhlE